MAGVDSQLELDPQSLYEFEIGCLKALTMFHPIEMWAGNLPTRV